MYYYTHPLERRNSNRFVLYGLQKLDIDVVMKLVKEAGAHPEKVISQKIAPNSWTNEIILYNLATPQN